MSTRLVAAGLVGAVFVAAGCSDAFSPVPRALGTPTFDVGAAGPAGIALDVWNGDFNNQPDATGRILRKGFNPRNPRVGDAIVATFFWQASTPDNIIASVVDNITNVDNTPVGNTYHLARYIHAGDISMATYVATNVQNFAGGSEDPNQILAVQANLSTPVTSAGVLISAWTGVAEDFANALGTSSARSGSGTSYPNLTTVDPGAIAAGAGALVYGASMANAVVGRDHSADFTQLAGMTNATIAGEGDYKIQAAMASANPQWHWNFGETPSTWLAMAMTLNPPPHFSFTVQPRTTLPLLAIQPAVQVTVLDALGKRVTSFNGPVTVAIGRNGGLVAPGTLSGTTTVTAVDGVATFSDLSIDQPGSGYTLVVAAARVTGAESVPFNIGAM